MSKKNENGIMHYEMLIIVSNKFTEEEIKPVIANVDGLISKHNGAVTYREDWSKRRLAYKIGEFQHGHYYLFEFDMASDKLPKLNRELNMSNEIVRHIVVAKEKRSSEEIEAEKRSAEMRVQKEKQAVKKEKEGEGQKTEKKKQVDMKDLDEKLEKILDTDDLL